MEREPMDAVFESLAHPVRRKILDVIKEHPGCSVNEVCDFFELSRIAIMKHLKVLERAELILSKKEGRTRELHFNAVPIQLIYERWTTEYSSYWASAMTRVKYRIEAELEKKKLEKKKPKPVQPDAPTVRKRHA